MDKKAEKKKDFKEWSVVVMVVCTIAAIIAICSGIARINELKNRVGDKSTEELSSEIVSLTREYEKVEDEKREEQEKNGMSDKYIELESKSAELNKEISQANGSRYMIETGVDNPNSLTKILYYAPQLWAGVVVFIGGIVISFIVKKKFSA